MLSELYSVCPEVGDVDKPKLIIFIDEAHLIFEEASIEIETIVDRSKIAAKYNQVIESNSAYEMLNAKLESAAAITPSPRGKTAKPEESTLEKVMNNTVVKSIIRTAGNTIVRSLLGSPGLGGRTRKSAKSWF